MIITDGAKAYIEEIMKEHGVSTLRFSFEGAGCCGPSWGMSLAMAEEDDIVQTVNGLEVAIDKKVLETVNKFTLDFEGAGEEAGLVFHGGESCC
ncbi:HesB/IscA family protein [Bacillus sp. BP-3]|uniref:HesB/IscA family protein n=1 Tax=Bacillus sp. BP-3 TaxID=3022773 RepID=UPI00232C576B|nr:iron-sulfur cluster biosynthesis family protein [Bacillus sp. BP-3]MDC2863170.1 iron-sulfur cluster biosynthesis family protein [Bacillus sp. BP-3]